MKKFDVEIVVGIFVFIGMLCLIFISVNLGKIDLIGGHYYPIKAVFSTVKGLKKKHRGRNIRGRRRYGR